ncbi:class I SAM-dependent methyltransferase [Pseudomonadota bacterium]
MATSPANGAYKFSEADYFDFVQNQYAPNQFERLEDDARFVSEGHNAWVNGQRFHRMLKFLNKYRDQLQGDPAIAVDIGLYPGTWIQLARQFWSDMEWHGVGLCISDEFREWASEEKVELAEADMDPFYAGFMSSDVSRSLPYDDNSFDFVVASEIFEHLISPLVFLEESSRVLKSGGLMLITTPNVSNIGAVVNLLRGRSNHERLLRSPMFLVEDEWRGHIRFYSKHELGWLADRYGFEMVDHQYFHDDYPISALRNKGFSSPIKRMIRRLFGIIPWFRGGQIVMFRRKD